MISSTKSTLFSFLYVLLHEQLQLCESHRAVTRMGWGWLNEVVFPGNMKNY